MIDFEEELKRFRPAPVLDDAEKLIRGNIIADIKDIIAEAQNPGRENATKTDTEQG